MEDRALADYGGPKFDALVVVDPTRQLSAAQYNRLAEDGAQGTRSAPRVWFAFDTSASAPSVGTFRSVWGSGTAQKPTPARTGAGVYTFTFPTSYDDKLGVTESVYLLFAVSAINGTTPGFSRASVTAANVITCYTFDTSWVASDLGGAAIVTVTAR